MFHRFLRVWLFAGVIAAGLSGCAWAPGSHMDYDVESAPIDDLVDVQPITPGLVAAYQRSVKGQARPASEEFRQALKEYEYEVGPGDILDIIVYDHPELTIPSGEQRSPAQAGNLVRNDGSIFYPYIGEVDVQGKTLDEIRRILTTRLVEYIAEPQVDVKVAAYRSKKAYVSGAVNEPGAQAMTNVPLTIRDAISQAGGTSQNANMHRAILTRNGQETPISLYALMRSGDQQENRLLRDGDVLHVTSADDQAVAVMGQVLRPGNVDLGNERLSLTDAIARAGGINEASAEPSGVFVVRNAPTDSQQLATVYQLDVRNAAAFSLGQRFTLEPNDVVYVTTAPVARWNRVISLLLPSVNLPGSLADTSNDIRNQ
ncbi:polysaccharide export protein [Halomonas salinarum]|uniref:polysaccharide export protein n=1 Tax=Halomonas salinarum TaxID=1158993 RepID=UPI00143B7DDD|nr:polysaccharide export protein [Halomonas salinarum]